MHRRNLKAVKHFSLIMFFTLLAACAKDKVVNEDGVMTPEKDGFAAGKINKKEISGCIPNSVSESCVNANEYLLVRTIEDANGNNPYGAIPGFQTSYGAVRVKIEKNELKFLPTTAYSITQYGYYGLKNEIVDLNEPVVSFPIEKHFDEGFDRNDYGEETNRKEELEEGPYALRQYIRVDWTNPKTKQFQLSTALGGYLSISEENAELAEEVKLYEDGSFSFVVNSRLTSVLRPDSHTVKIRTTLLRLSPGASHKRIYTDEDFLKFGIFRAFKYKIGMQGDLRDENIEKLAKVYNLCSAAQGGECSKNQIVMHVSEGMEPEYKELSRKAVSAWNAVFQTALDRNDQVIVFNENEVPIGDVRKNIIAMVDTNFVAGSLLGVAQFTTHPETGETISSRSTVFKDGIESTKGAVDRILDTIITNPYTLRDFLLDGKHDLKRMLEGQKMEASLAKLNKAQNDDFHASFHFDADTGLDVPGLKAKQLASVKNVVKSTLQYHRNISEILVNDKFAAKTMLRNLDAVGKADPNFAADDVSLGGAEQLLTERQKDAVSRNLVKTQEILLAGAEKHFDTEVRELFGEGMSSRLNLFENRELNMSYHGIHSAEIVEESVLAFVKSFVLRSLKQGLGAGLTDEETLEKLRQKLEAGDVSALVSLLQLDFASGSRLRETMKEEVGKRVFYTTLLHEMGHAFGLRHNFIASVDQKNFHPKYHELKDKLKACSVSGSCSELNKYDLESWAFSSVMDYNAGFHSDLVELGPYDKAAIQYAYNPAKPVKGSFLFCSDEHVADNVLCNRHDKGVNLSEITLNRIKSYEARYFRAFFRMGRTFFGNYAGSMAMNYMLPIRTVMDESIYQLLNARPASPELAAATGCSSHADAISNYKVEGSLVPEFIVNTCDNAALERFLSRTNVPKTPVDLDAIEYAINYEKPVSEFFPLSRADIALSNVMAKRFFTNILGSGEPGAYLPEVKGGMTVLTKIPDTQPLSASGGNVNAWVQQVANALGAMASERGEIPQNFVNANLKKVVNIDIGIGKYLESFADANSRILNVGSLYEKYYAMLILGTRYVGVPKYVRASLTGNAYLWPHTRDFATKTFGKMIQRESYISALQYESITGQKGVGYIEAKQDSNTQNLASLFASAFFSNEQDTSFYRKVRVYNTVDECQAEAQKSEGSDSMVKVEIGGSVLCAFDDLAGESIVVPMLEKVKEASDQIKNWKEIIANKPSLVAQASLGLSAFIGDEASALHKKLYKGARGFGDLSSSLILVTSNDYQKNLETMPKRSLFDLIEKSNELQENSFAVVIGQLAKVISTQVEGGMPAFQQRVIAIVTGQIPREEVVNPPKGGDSDKSKKRFKGHIEGVEVVWANQSLIFESVDQVSANSDYMTDKQLTQIARLYLDLSDYMNAVSSNINILIQVRASDILLSRAISDFDQAKSPLERLLHMVDSFQ